MLITVKEYADKIGMSKGGVHYAKGVYDDLIQEYMLREYTKQKFHYA